MVAREELEVDVPAALTLGKAEVEIRLKANGQVSDPVNLTATITDVTRVAEAPSESAPRVLAVTPKRVGAGQSLMISIDQRRTLEPSPKQTQVIIEQDNARYIATIEKNSAQFGPSKAPDGPVGLFVRTTRQFIGHVQIRVLNPLRGEQTGLSAPVPLEIVDEVLPPEVSSVSESTDAELERLRQMDAMQKEAGNDVHMYDPNLRFLTIRGQGIDYNPNFVRITLEQADQKFTLSLTDFATYSNDALIVRLPKDLKAGNVKFTIENSGGDRYSTPVTKSFVLQPR
jgi:virulence-associated protein VagC